jgi:hypothetical protein
MAGEALSNINLNGWRDDTTYVNFSYPTAAMIATDSQYIPLFIADRRCKVDRCVARWDVVEATNDNLTIGVSKSANGGGLETNTDITSTEWTVTAGADTVTSLTIDTDNNILEVGDTLILEGSDAGGTTELAGFVGSIRLCGLDEPNQ